MDDRASAALISTGVDQRQASDYRADIDGLRALAVLPIVAFHLGFRYVGGGYIGVDIFFVISGYLIGGHVLRQVREGRYSIVDFYIRRFRRIVPALAVVLLFTTAAVCILSFPNMTADYGKSLLATTLFSSNFYFLSSAGYFASASDTKPLLHTWSLAVEEQYYIFFPLLILSVRRFGARAIHITIAVSALLSLVASILFIDAYPTATFYLLPTRIWELLLGVLAIVVPARFLDVAWRREVIACIGAASVAGPILLYSPDTPFPGIAAVPPCLGTAMLLAAGAHGRSVVSRLLSWRPCVFFGLISYSLYLWHWPIIVLLKQAVPLDSLSLPWRAAAFLLSVTLAWLSWRTIERPWRNPAVRPRTILTGVVASGAVLGIAGMVLVETGGLPGRYDPRIARIAAMQDHSESNDFRDGTCFISSGYSFSDFNQSLCLKRDPARPNVLLMGDSHAAHLWSGLTKRFPGVKFLQATASGCKPVMRRDPDAAPRCNEMMRFLFEDYLPSHPVDRIIVSGQWFERDAADVARTLDWLHAQGFEVVLGGPILQYKASLPQLLAIAKLRGDPDIVTRARKPGEATLDTTYRNLAAAHGALYFSPYEALCHGKICRVSDVAGLPLQFDYGHLTAEGSFEVTAAFPMSRFSRSHEAR